MKHFGGVINDAVDNTERLVVSEQNRLISKGYKPEKAKKRSYQVVRHLLASSTTFSQYNETAKNILDGRTSIQEAVSENIRKSLEYISQVEAARTPPQPPSTAPATAEAVKKPTPSYTMRQAYKDARVGIMGRKKFDRLSVGEQVKLTKGRLKEGLKWDEAQRLAREAAALETGGKPSIGWRGEEPSKPDEGLERKPAGEEQKREVLVHTPGEVQGMYDGLKARVRALKEAGYEVSEAEEILGYSKKLMTGNNFDEAYRKLEELLKTLE